MPVALDPTKAHRWYCSRTTLLSEQFDIARFTLDVNLHLYRTCGGKSTRANAAVCSITRPSKGTKRDDSQLSSLWLLGLFAATYLVGHAILVCGQYGAGPKARHY